MTLYILEYNNYYNRVVKSLDTVTEYLPYVIYSTTGVNFNPADGVDTSQLIGTGGYDGTGDYVLVVNDLNEIVSKWFIVNSERTRAGQYNLSLHRDLVVDYYNIIKDNPVFVEKATLREDDPFVFNPEEGMTFNQIKKSETLLKDKTGCSWIVAYIARKKAGNQDYNISGSVGQSGVADIIADRDTWQFKDYIDSPMSYGSSEYQLKWNFYNKVGYNDPTYLQATLFKQNTQSTVTSSFSRTAQSVGIASNAVNYSDAQFNQAFSGTYEEILNYLPTASGLSFEDNSTANELRNLNSNTIKFIGDNNIYRIKVVAETKTFSSPFSSSGSVSSSDLLYLKVQPLWKTILTYANPQQAISVGKYYEYSFKYEQLTIKLEAIGIAGDLGYEIPTARLHLTDAPYDMICAPYENIRIKITTEDGTLIFTSYSDYILTVFNDIAVKYAGGDSPVVYDIQRLPYCPITSFQLLEDGSLDATNYSESHKAFKISKGGVTYPVGVIFGCTTSNFYKSILLDDPIAINNAKMQSSCDMYRLCSPNYNGVFEFDAAMNGGLSSINVYCSYKPFNPYIQLSPNFSLLYGSNFNDARGLICGGEWSLPIVTSQWATYERNNVNYNNIFQRGIENLKITQKYEKTSDIISAIVGTAQGAGAGAFLQSAWKPGTGMLAGGVLGGVASAVGGIADVYMKEKLRQETLSYTEDMFSYQMGNIKALPQSLSRTSAFTINNKIFPFLEYYTCTEEEKVAFANKIAYNGMTVMRVGKLTDFAANSWSYTSESGQTIVSKGYFKGRLIKTELQNISEDYHVLNAINEEINRGFYLQ